MGSIVPLRPEMSEFGRGMLDVHFESLADVSYEGLKKKNSVNRTRSPQDEFHSKLFYTSSIYRSSDHKLRSYENINSFNVKQDNCQMFRFHDECKLKILHKKQQSAVTIASSTLLQEVIRLQRFLLASKTSLLRTCSIGFTKKVRLFRIFTLL